MVIISGIHQTAVAADVMLHRGVDKFDKYMSCLSSRPIDVKVVVPFIMRMDQAALLAIGSRECWADGHCCS